MDDCLFCKILKGDIPSQEVYSDEHCYAFRDIDPKAPEHILVIPRTHVASIHEIDDPALFSLLMTAATAIVLRDGFEQKGYRIVVNSGDDGGQLVHQLHLYILAGLRLGSMG